MNLFALGLFLALMSLANAADSDPPLANPSAAAAPANDLEKLWKLRGEVDPLVQAAIDEALKLHLPHFGLLPGWELPPAAAAAAAPANYAERPRDREPAFLVRGNDGALELELTPAAAAAPAAAPANDAERLLRLQQRAREVDEALAANAPIDPMQKLDPLLGNVAVTYDQCVPNFLTEDLRLMYTAEHWDNLPQLRVIHTWEIRREFTTGARYASSAALPGRLNTGGKFQFKGYDFALDVESGLETSGKIRGHYKLNMAGGKFKITMHHSTYSQNAENMPCMYIRVERLKVGDVWEIVNDYPRSALPLERNHCHETLREIFDLNPNPNGIGMKITILATL